MGYKCVNDFIVSSFNVVAVCVCVCVCVYYFLNIIFINVIPRIDMKKRESHVSFLLYIVIVCFNGKLDGNTISGIFIKYLL